MMHYNYNNERPMIMHIDLNSCFATIEQQARPMLRGRPVAIANRRTEHTCIVTASYEAKKFGANVGMKLSEAKRLVPGLIVLESDPPKYRFVYRKLMAIMRRYSAHITMKSIDEGVIDFHQATDLIQRRDLKDVGQEIKQTLINEVGKAMICNVGIAPNRFLAKTAASLNKPNGLDVIDHTSLRPALLSLQLRDLTGIAKHNERRLNAVGIYTPIEFLDANPDTLRHMVFKSILGVQWHQRLRGWEVDDVVYDMKTVGRQYVLESQNLSKEDILRRLHHLCESVGHRMRSKGRVARGVYVYARTYDRDYWHRRQMSPLPFYSNQAIYAQAALLFAQAPAVGIREIGISCYQLEDTMPDQLSLFGDQLAREQQVTDAVDEINRRFGDRTIHAANTLGTGLCIKQKVPFGSTRYL
jgi:DNA polymerase-4